MSGFQVEKDPLKALNKYFGFSSLREGQDEVVKNILEGKNVLIVMPTGGGKSLCYQLPALCREGVTLVVSPLIALMKDQVDALVDKSIPATMINSSLSGEEQRERLMGVRSGLYKLVYIAPERFGQPGFMRQIADLDISLIAIDEAHCLSQWGHDFRPDYLRLGQVIETMGSPQVVALTATATPKVREDILHHLHLVEPEVIIRGFARDNLNFRISQCDNHDEKYKRLHRLIAEYKTGIIYCSTRKKVEQVYQVLKDLQLNVTAYHAGMTDAQRSIAQNDFMEKRADVVIATNAFGMGIDRSDVRFVAHFEIPGSVEAYYQEAGRAGRDGEIACCELLFNHADLRTQEFFIDGSNPAISLIVDLYELLRKHASAENCSVEWTVEEMAEKLQSKNSMAVTSALIVLMKQGAINRYDIPGKRIKGTQVVDMTLSGLKIPIDYLALEEKERRDRDKLKSVTEFAYSHGCRQQWILNYFGEVDHEPCGHCDQCDDSGVSSGSELDESCLVIVKKALSGIARASFRNYDGQWQGRWGRLKIIQMLRGNKTQAIVNSSLGRLSTYGILSEYSEDELKKLFKSMQLSGLLCLSGEHDRPLTTISPRGHEVMMGRQSVKMIWPLAKKHQSKKQVLKTNSNSFDLAELDVELFEKLKALRNELAQDMNIPGFCVFHNSVLETMARMKPTTIVKAMTIQGIGKKKSETYLQDFLDLIYEHVSQ